MWVASSSQFLRFAVQLGACCLHPRDQLIDVRCSYECGTIPPEWQSMAVEPSRGVEIIQRSLMWFGETEQAAAAVQQPRELARLTTCDQQPIVDGDVGRVALGQAERMCLGDDSYVPRMRRGGGWSPNAGNLP